MPKLADADVDLIHTLWLDATKDGGVEGLHHREIVTVALARLAEEMKGPSVRRRSNACGDCTEPARLKRLFRALLARF